MITNYSDPIVTLNQEYRQSNVGISPQLGAYIIGPNFYIYRHQFLDDMQHFCIKSEAAFNKESQQICDFPAPIDGYQGSVDKDSIKLFVKNAKVKVGTSTTATYNGEYTLTVTDAFATKLKVGDIASLVYVTEEGVSTEQSQEMQTYIADIKYAQDNKTMYIVLQQGIEAKSILQQVSFFSFSDVYATSGYTLWDKKSSTVVTDKWIDRNKEEFSFALKFNNNAILKAGQNEINAGDIYIQYKAQNTAFLNTYGTISSSTYIKQMLGIVNAQNPLALGVAAALSESNGRTVYFKAVSAKYSQDTTKAVQIYKQAVDLISNNDNIYGVVPCTSNAQVQKALLGLIKEKAGQEVPVLKYLYGNVQIPEDGLYPLLAIRGNRTNQFIINKVQGTAITVEQSLIYFQPINKGDIIKSGDKQFTVKSVNTALKRIELTSAVDSLTAKTSIRIFHKVNSDDIKANADHIKHLIANKMFSDTRGAIVFADTASFDAMHVPNYAVAAALAGMRSATYAHAPLSNIVFNSITTEDKRGFTRSQLNELGANGFWRVGLNSYNETISRRQLTSAAANDVNKDQQSIICNIDSICMMLKGVGRQLVGSTNISPQLIAILQSTLNSRLDSIKVYEDVLIGPQLLQATLVSIKQDAVFKDRIYAQMQGQPPKPFNRFHMKFYIN